MAFQVSDQTYDEIIEHKTMKLNGEIAYKRYGKRKFLGKGGFAKCYEGIDLQTKKLVAIKIVEKSTLTKNRTKQKLLSQIKIHKALHHKHIVQFDSVFEDSTCVYMILELCPNKTLSEMVRKRKQLTVQQTQFYVLQLISAIQYMHQNRVIHRDLKMGNIFLNEKMEIKVGDFGLAAKLEFSQEKKRTICGTPNYIAPEIVQGVTGHSYEVDIWSAGVICFALLFGRPPFETTQVKATYKRIKSCQYDFPNEDIPNSAKHFIKSILILDPKKRLTISQMLEHPFLNMASIPKAIPVEALTTIPSFDISSPTPIKKSIYTQQQEFNQKVTKSTSVSSSTKQPSIQQLKQLKYIKMQQVLKKPYSYGNQEKKQQEVRSSLKSPRISSQREDLSKREHLICQTKEAISSQHPISILSFVDYSTKYGLGYLINNRTYGVYFNDSTLMSIDADKKTISYVQNPSNKQQNIQEYPYISKNSKFPNDKNFQKKIMLLEKFILYLDEQVAKNNSSHSDYQKYDQFVYIKQWLKTKHAIMFRLSNKIFQVNFFDNSQILLNTDYKTVLFTSKKGVKSFQTLTKALQAKDSEMGRRIKYTKEILNSIKKGKDEEAAEEQHK